MEDSIPAFLSKQTPEVCASASWWQPCDKRQRERRDARQGSNCCRSALMFSPSVSVMFLRAYMARVDCCRGQALVSEERQRTCELWQLCSRPPWLVGGTRQATRSPARNTGTLAGHEQPPHTFPPHQPLVSGCYPGRTGPKRLLLKK